MDIAVFPCGVWIHVGRYFQASGRVSDHCPVARMQRAQHGGRDFTVDEVYQIFDELEDADRNGREIRQYQYIGLRK